MKRFIWVWFFFFLCLSCFGAGYKISDLERTNTVGGGEWVELDQGGIKSWRISTADFWRALGTNGQVTLISITTNIVNLNIVTNQYVYQTNYNFVTVTTNLYVIQTNYFNYTYTTNITVYQTNISNYEITTNSITYQTNINNYVITTNLITYQTNISYYTITTNLYVIQTNISYFTITTNLYASNIYTTNIYVTEIAQVKNLYATNLYVTNLYVDNPIMGLQQLTNVAITNATAGDALAWDDTMKKWTNKPVAQVTVITNIGVLGTNIAYAAINNMDFSSPWNDYQMTNSMASHMTNWITNLVQGASISLSIVGTNWYTNWNVYFYWPPYATVTWISITNGSPTTIITSNKLQFYSFLVRTNGTQTNVIASFKEQP